MVIVTDIKPDRHNRADKRKKPHDMKVLLVKPSWQTSAATFASPPLGLMYLSSSIKQRFPGIKTRLIDLRFEKTISKTIEEEAREWQPDIVGILALTGDEYQLNIITRSIKRINKMVHICCGGPFPTHSPEDFNRLKYVDSIIRGEGEKSFGDLIGLLSTTDNTAGMTGSGFSIRNQHGIIEPPDHSCPISNLDELPFPDWDLIDINLYSKTSHFNSVMAGKRYMVLFTSRGCPFDCIYCHHIFGKKIRLRSPENVVKEISILVHRYKVDEIQIIDDFFNFDRSRLMAICDLIIEKKLRIHICFPNGIRGDMLDNEAILKLKQAGVYMITFAIETASERLQKLIKKNLNINKTIHAIKFANSQGLITRSFFIIGFPTETKEEIKQTISLPSRLPLTTFSIFKATPFKGTELYKLVLKTSTKEGIESLNKPVGTFFAQKTFYTADTGISLNKYILLCYFRFFTPYRLIRFFIKIPRKITYLKQVSSTLMVGFLPRNTERFKPNQYRTEQQPGAESQKQLAGFLPVKAIRKL